MLAAKSKELSSTLLKFKWVRYDLDADFFEAQSKHAESYILEITNPKLLNLQMTDRKEYNRSFFYPEIGFVFRYTGVRYPRQL